MAWFHLAVTPVWKSADIPSTNRLSTIVSQRQRISTVIARVPFSTTVFDDLTNGFAVLEQEWKGFSVCLHHNGLLSWLTSSLQQFVSQFQAFENCLLGLAGNIYATAVVDIWRLLHLQLQNITEDDFNSQVIPHRSGPKKLNTQQHIQVCSVITSYRLIDIMARVSGLPSNGLEVSRGLYEVENKEPEVNAQDHCFQKFNWLPDDVGIH